MAESLEYQNWGLVDVDLYLAAAPLQLHVSSSSGFSLNISG